MRYSVARQSDTEQQEMVVPGWTRLRNQGARAGSAFGGGSAMAAPATNITAAKNGLIIRAAGFPKERTPFMTSDPGGGNARLEQRRGDAQSLEPDRARTRPVKRRVCSGHSLARTLGRGFYDCDD